MRTTVTPTEYKRHAWLHTANRLLWGCLWVIGLAACAALVWMFGWAEPVPEGGVARLHEVERSVERLPGLTLSPFNQATFAELARRTPPGPLEGNAAWHTVSLPDVRPLPLVSDLDGAKSQAWFRIRYTVPASQTPEVPLALYGTRVLGAGAYTVWANGELVWANLQDWRMQWNNPLFVTLPLALSRPGSTVELLLALPFRDTQGYALGSLYVGSAPALLPGFEMRRFFQRGLPFIATGVGLLMGVLSLQFWLVRRNESVHGMLAAASLAWLVSNVQYTHEFSVNDTVSLWYGHLVDASISWMLILVFLFAFRLGERRYPRVEAALGLYVLVNTLCTLPVWGWQVNALAFQQWILIALAFAVIGLMSWECWHTRHVDLMVLTASVWVLFVFGVHDMAFMASQKDPDSVWLFPYGTIMVFLAFIFATQRRYLGALTHVEQSNAHLAQQLAQREQELQATHQALRTVEQRQTVLLERQRLVRDMHDGIGSSLMSSLAVAQGQNAQPAQIARVLQECLDDLKLVIESLEPLEHDLPTLLGALRHRFGYRLEAAGLAVEWEMADLPELPWLDAPQALQIMRIVQEVLANVIKHAKASCVRVETTLAVARDGSAQVVLYLQDDGMGFGTTQGSTGRGLKNMQARAALIGGVLTLQSSVGAGTTVELRLPVHQATELPPGASTHPRTNNVTSGTSPT